MNGAVLNTAKKVPRAKKKKYTLKKILVLFKSYIYVNSHTK